MNESGFDPVARSTPVRTLSAREKRQRAGGEQSKRCSFSQIDFTWTGREKTKKGGDDKNGGGTVRGNVVWLVAKKNGGHKGGAGG